MGDCLSEKSESERRKADPTGVGHRCWTEVSLSDRVSARVRISMKSSGVLGDRWIAAIWEVFGGKRGWAVIRTGFKVTKEGRRTRQGGESEYKMTSSRTMGEHDSK